MKKYSIVLQSALDNEIVSFPSPPITKYGQITAYRGITSRVVRDLNRDDFCSQAELYQQNHLKGAFDSSDWEKYSCSCFRDRAELEISFHLPRPNKKIAKGMMDDRFGSMLSDTETSHIHWFLYENCDPGASFSIEE